jgi:cell division protein FtsQ
MADISSISQSELADRRRQLRRQRRWRTAQTIWQVLMVSSFAGGLIWALASSDWMLRNPGQVSVEGNQFLSADTIRSILPIHYPQSLFSIQPQTIAQHLEAEAPIADATVTRRLFPPSLTVQIQERYPVAIAYLSVPSPPSNPSTPESPGKPVPQAALLDEEGAWIPYDVYLALNPQGLPDLKVMGMREEYRSHWATLYQQVSQSPVKISEINWHDPNNLILKTDLGLVYLGPYGSQLAEQLRLLDQMRLLSEQVRLDQVAYIDLRNLDVPLIEMKAGGDPESWKVPSH